MLRFLHRSTLDASGTSCDVARSTLRNGGMILRRIQSVQTRCLARSMGSAEVSGGVSDETEQATDLALVMPCVLREVCLPSARYSIHVMLPRIVRPSLSSRYGRRSCGRYCRWSVAFWALEASYNQSQTVTASVCPPFDMVVDSDPWSHERDVFAPCTCTERATAPRLSRCAVRRAMLTLREHPQSV